MRGLRPTGFCVALLLAAAPSCALFTDLGGLAGTADPAGPDGGTPDDGDAGLAPTLDAMQASDTEVDAPPGERACAKPHTFCADFDVSEDPKHGFTGGGTEQSGSLTTSETDSWSSPRSLVARVTPVDGGSSPSALVSASVGATPAIHIAFRMKVEANDFANTSVIVAVLDAYSSTEGLKQVQLTMSGSEVNLRAARFDPNTGETALVADNKAPFAIDGAWHLFEIDASTEGDHRLELKIDGVSRLNDATLPGSLVDQYVAHFGLWYPRPVTGAWQVRLDDIAIDTR